MDGELFAAVSATLRTLHDTKHTSGPSALCRSHTDCSTCSIQEITESMQGFTGVCKGLLIEY